MKTENNMFLKDEVSTIIFNDEDLRDYVVSIISESSGLERDFVSDNLVLDNNRINSNSEIKFSEVDSIYHNDYMYFNIEIHIKVIIQIAKTLDMYVT